MEQQTTQKIASVDLSHGEMDFISTALNEYAKQFGLTGCMTSVGILNKFDAGKGSGEPAAVIGTPNKPK